MDKLEKRRLKLAAKAIQPPNVSAEVSTHSTQHMSAIDCACVIHGHVYDWIYVERLYSMLARHLTPQVRLHVYTEADRAVPAPMIKHALAEWNLAGPRRGWWYKMQLFNPENHSGPLLYFDLDTVIVNNIDWIWQQPLKYFWAVRDFKYLWRPGDYRINSSVMWWDTNQFESIWLAFQREDIKKIIKTYPGDQDYLNMAIPDTTRRLFPIDQIVSWRWQCLDGGYNFNRRSYAESGTGTAWNQQASVLIFHGTPKPADLSEPVITAHWR